MISVTLVSVLCVFSVFSLTFGVSLRLRLAGLRLPRRASVYEFKVLHSIPAYENSYPTWYEVLLIICEEVSRFGVTLEGLRKIQVLGVWIAGSIRT